MMRRFLLKRLLKKYKPELVAVFGVYGREEAREAIRTVLAPHAPAFSHKSEGTIGALVKHTGFVNIIRGQFFSISFPHFIVIDTIGADSDFSILKNILPIGLAVVMPMGDIPIKNQVFAGSREPLHLIKKAIEQAIDGLLVHDDETVRELSDRAHTRYRTFGFDEHADLRIISAKPQLSIHTSGVDGATIFEVEFHNQKQKAVLKNTLGKRNIYAGVAALGAALRFGVELTTAAQDLSAYIAPTHSLRITEGIKRTAILSHIGGVAPFSAREALELMGFFRRDGQIKRSVAIIGDIIMHQDAEYFEGLHRALGEFTAQNVDTLFLAGERVVFLEDEAKKHGMPDENIRRFDTVAEAAREAQNFIASHDGMLIMGSAPMRMEDAVRELEFISA